MSQVVASPDVVGQLNLNDWIEGGAADSAVKRTEFISFAIGGDQYGVDIVAVREIKGWSNITRLPNQPDYMHGVLNLRSVMVPTMDLRCRFGQGKTDATPVHIIIVVQVGAKTVGVLADRVLDIVAVNTSQIQPVPQVSRNSRASFLAGLVTVDNAMITLINLEHLLSEQSEMDTLAPA